MKEGEPEELFHIQEERRLFYVALTRAENRLTLTSLTEKKAKMPLFIEDIFMDPAIKRRDVHQMSPKLRKCSRRERKTRARRTPTLPAPPSRRKFFRASRIGRWNFIRRRRNHSPCPSAVNGTGCPQHYFFILMVLQEGPKAVLTFGRVMHATIRRMMAEFKKGLTAFRLTKCREFSKRNGRTWVSKMIIKKGNTRRTGWSSCGPSIRGWNRRKCSSRKKYRTTGGEQCGA